MTLYFNPNEPSYFTVNIPNLYVGALTRTGSNPPFDKIGPWYIYLTSRYSNTNNPYSQSIRFTCTAVESNDRYTKFQIDQLWNGNNIYWDKDTLADGELVGYQPYNTTPYPSPTSGQQYNLGLVKYINYQYYGETDTSSDLELNPIYTDSSNSDNPPQTVTNDSAMSFVIYKQ
jgi:hypothetical protein